MLAKPEAMDLQIAGDVEAAGAANAKHADHIYGRAVCDAGIK